MLPKATLKAHAELVDTMANTLRVDLDEAMMQGRMTPGQLADAVLACTGCSQPGHCRSWLATHDQADVAPDYCRNGETFRWLAEGKHV